jgi:hypothetical protein
MALLACRSSPGRMAFSERAMQGFRGVLMEEVGGDVEVCGVVTIP